MDLTIVIPTKNRNFFYNQILIYYKNVNFTDKLLINDNSGKDIYEKIKI